MAQNDDNFNKWRDPKGMKTKSAVAGDLASTLKAKGCHANCIPSQVQEKVARIESQMRQEYDFIHSETAIGLLENEPFE